MAWYNVDYTCGHTERIQLYGPERERQRKIEWFEKNNVCSTCFSAEKERVRAAETAKAKEQNAALAELKGTPKQISWAETIRAAVKGRIEHVLGKVAETGEMSGFPLADWVAIGQQILSNDEAKHWIDKRSDYDVTEGGMCLLMATKLKAERVKAAGAAALKGGN